MSFIYDSTGRILFKRAHKKGTCPLCKKDFTRGTWSYYDKRKPDGSRYVHSYCYERLLWDRYEGKESVPF